MRRVKNVKRRRRKVGGNHSRRMKSWKLQQQAQEAFLFFFRFSSRTLICLAEQPITSLFFGEKTVTESMMEALMDFMV